MTSKAAQPSSASAGFFQSFPVVPPQYTSSRSPETAAKTDSDPVLSSVLNLYLPTPLPKTVDEHLHTFARICLDAETLRLTVSCETNPPTLHNRGTFGDEDRVNPLSTSEGWRGLKKIQTRNGGVGLGYSLPPGSDEPVKWNRRIHQAAINHLWSGSSALVTCPAAMSDAAALLLGRHLEDEGHPGQAAVMAEARRRLISFDPCEAWTSGQWMTERVGGSDVGGTETLARRLCQNELMVEKKVYGAEEDSVGMPLGPWRIDGFKWFSSATDSDMTILLAKTDIGVSAFYAPMRRRLVQSSGQVVSILNGVKISRLKDKMGTKGLPTAELELKGMRAWLIGDEGKGIKEIVAMLGSTRLRTGSDAVACWSRGLAVARAYSKVRTVKSGTLIDNELHCAWMAGETVKYSAAAHFIFLGWAIQGVAEQGATVTKKTKAEAILPSTPTEAEALLRVLTPVMKARCSLASITGLRECMECLGGVGYLENNSDGGVLNLARLYRDCNANAIWEGTTTVLAEDLVRAFRGRQGGQAWNALDGLVSRLFKSCSGQFNDETATLLSKWNGITHVVNGTSPESVLDYSRQLLEDIEDVICAGLLMFDAFVTKDNVDAEIARRFMVMRFQAGEQKMTLAKALNKVIFLGRPSHDIAAKNPKL